jgi:DNA-binding transcriptional MerR regulator
VRHGLLGTGEVSRLAGVSPKTAVNWIDSGLLTGYALASGHRRCWRRDLAEFLLRHGMQMPEELRHYVEEEFACRQEN